MYDIYMLYIPLLALIGIQSWWHFVLCFFSYHFIFAFFLLLFWRYKLLLKNLLKIIDYVRVIQCNMTFFLTFSFQKLRHRGIAHVALSTYFVLWWRDNSPFCQVVDSWWICNEYVCYFGASWICMSHMFWAGLWHWLLN